MTSEDYAVKEIGEFLESLFGPLDKEEIGRRIAEDSSLRFTSNLYKKYEIYCDIHDLPPRTNVWMREYLSTELYLDVKMEKVTLPDGTDCTRSVYFQGGGAHTVKRDS